MNVTNIILGRAEPLNWPRQTIQDFASTLAKDLNYGPGDDISELVREVGGSIVVSDVHSPVSTGSIEVRGPRDFTIYLSPYSGHRRRRFTIAHELGHYFLHSKSGQKPIRVDRDGSGTVEWEANWFAAGFLMPKEEFQAKCDEGYSDAELAKHFDVSMDAVKIRQKTA